MTSAYRSRPVFARFYARVGLVLDRGRGGASPVSAHILGTATRVGC